ncbi:HINT domain-containing protein [Mumia sp. zg.B17]|uniref:polymorphic toxin-type HINT domain-containing protein n=1 Tax=Mumia sp. zg.B17 TaxID=2855446 RepID=UPI001C6ED8C7|nr:polymorphic toxin-type HINT domain-containing protein [Mumia sp. zg.B17]MBW9207143.1 HINT domain-containing protein [Mumia sp. zg.B17]
MTDEYRRALSAVSTSNAQETECRSRRSIEDIKVGDRVMASDPQTDEQAARRVEAVHVHKDIVTDIKVDGEVITTTEDHPFWSVDSQTFERADELSLGERVLSADGKQRVVGGVVGARAGRQALAYNLSIQGIHTYHVGALDVLVHNMCATGVAAKYGDDAIEGIGDARTYIDLTKPSSIRNVGTNASHTEFADNLTGAGWASRTSKDGAVQIFQRDGAKYVLRSKNSSGYAGWTADFTPAGLTRHTLEIRLRYTP